VQPYPGFLDQAKEEESKKPDLQSAMLVTSMRPNSFYETKTKMGTFLENKAGVEQNEYHCKNCGFKMFGSQDIIHSGDKKSGTTCSSIYLKYMSWMGYFRTNSAKLFCPNAKCGSIIGYVNKNGGKCSCGKPIETMHVVYPLKVVTSKAKTSSLKAW